MLGIELPTFHPRRLNSSQLSILSRTYGYIWASVSSVDSWVRTTVGLSAKNWSYTGESYFCRLPHKHACWPTELGEPNKPMPYVLTLAGTKDLACWNPTCLIFFPPNICNWRKVRRLRFTRSSVNPASTGGFRQLMCMSGESQAISIHRANLCIWAPEHKPMPHLSYGTLALLLFAKIWLRGCGLLGYALTSE